MVTIGRIMKIPGSSEAISFLYGGVMLGLGDSISSLLTISLAQKTC
jgi:hypothetical protein